MECSTIDKYVDCIVDILNIIKENKGRVCSALKRCLNELLDPTFYEGGHHNMSEKAFKEAKSEKLRYLTWQQLGKYKLEKPVSSNGKRAFILEHFYLRKYLRKELIDLKKPNRNDVEKIIIDKLKTCVITAEENKKLEELGYGSDRRNPEEAYRKAHITLKYSW